MGSAVGRTRNLDAKVTVYNETRPWLYGRDGSIPLREGFFHYNHARRRGDRLRFVAEGPDAVMAMEAIKDLLANPVERVEAFRGLLDYLSRP